VNPTEHLFVCLGEEGTEVAHIVSKILRFGVDDRNVLIPDGPTNMERLVDELNDLEAVIDMLVESGVIPSDWPNRYKQNAKKDKVDKFMLYAADKGTLQWKEAK
jgi:hypothetical protein